MVPPSGRDQPRRFTLNAAPIFALEITDISTLLYVVSHLFFIYVWLPIVPSMVVGVLSGYTMNEYDEFLGLVWGFGVGLVVAVAGLVILLSVPGLDGSLTRETGGTLIHPPSAGEFLCQAAVGTLGMVITLMGCRWRRKRQLKEREGIP